MFYDYITKFLTTSKYENKNMRYHNPGNFLPTKMFSLGLNCNNFINAIYCFTTFVLFYTRSVHV